MANADGDELDRRARFDFLDDIAQVGLQIIAGIDREGGVVDWRAVGNHHEDLALLGAAEKTLVRPVERLAVDVLLEQALAHHEAKVLARAPPRRVRRFVNEMAQIVETSGIGWFPCLKPGLARLSAFPGASREAENLDLDAAALECARENIRASRRNRDRTAAHGTRIVYEQRHRRVAERHILLLLEGQGLLRIDNHARQARGIEHALFEVELP